VRPRHGVAALAAVLLCCATVAALAAPRVATPAAEHPLDAEDRRPRAETNVAVDPRNPRHVVVSAIQFGRPYRDALVDKGYEPDDNVWVSVDGGASYRHTGNLPPMNAATPTSNDPTLAWDPHGPLYASYTSFAKPLGGVGPRDGLYVARSDDGGVHWRRLAYLEGFDCEGPDRSTVTVDPRNGAVYVTWVHYVEDASCAGTVDFTKTVLRWARSTDGGRTFSRPVDVSTNDQGVMPAPAVLADGTLAVAYLGPWRDGTAAAPCHGYTAPVYVARYAPTGRALGRVAAIQDLCSTTLGLAPNGAAFVPIPTPRSPCPAVAWSWRRRTSPPRGAAS